MVRRSHSMVKKYTNLFEKLVIHGVDFILPIRLTDDASSRDKDQKKTNKKMMPPLCSGGGFFSSHEQAILQYRSLCSKTTSKLTLSAVLPSKGDEIFQQRQTFNMPK